MNDITHTTKWGSFALVSYIPDPLGSFLHDLRRSFPGEHNPQPHITILPPRPLKLPVDAALQRAHNVLLQFAAFEVELSKVRFFPETNVLYLDIAKGNRVLHDLHEALNAGDLDHSEEFEFRPHLTLSGRVESAHLPGFAGRLKPPGIRPIIPVALLWTKSYSYGSVRRAGNANGTECRRAA